MQQALFDKARGLVAGVDEVGRGPLAGPVVAAAVILDPARPVTGVKDSKALTETRREALANELRSNALAWSIAWADAAEIDTVNILEATHLAMRRAILGLRVRPAFIEIDGNRLPNLVFNGEQIDATAVVGGDACIPAIGAASIVAKVFRDELMKRMDRIYPDYGFARHKGYGTEQHMQSIEHFGPCPLHRRSFRPISLL